MNILLVEQLAKSYREKELFSDITFGLEEGQKVALIARNGAGKTSLLNIISGIDQPDQGNIVMRKGTRVAYLPQNPYFRPGISVIDALFESDNDVIHAIKSYEHHLDQLKHADTPENHVVLAEASHLMDSLSAWDYESRVKEILGKFNIPDLDMAVDQLSGGQRKKIALARALIEKVDLLILDEPTSAMDPIAEHAIFQHLRNEIGDRIIVLITHRLYNLKLADHIYVMDQGTVAESGSFSQLMESRGAFANIYDKQMI